MAVTAPHPARDEGSVGLLDRNHLVAASHAEFARLKQLLACSPHPTYTGRRELLKKMIKEDHLLACTTKMLEILVALFHQLGQTLASRETTWIVRTTQVHLSFRTHILAAIRLFTCQRALLLLPPNSYRISATTLLQTSVATFVTVVVVPLGEADISVSFAGVNRSSRRFSAASFRRRSELKTTRDPEPLDRFRTVRTTINFWLPRNSQCSNVTVRRCG